MLPRSTSVLILPLICLTLGSCQTVSKWVPDVPMPKIPDMTGMKRILPGSDDVVSNDDPSIPFDVRRPLAYGHTLRLEIYEGARSGREVFAGLAMVDENGVLQIGKVGSAKVGGRTLVEAIPMIESVCRIAGKAALQTYVHVISVENVELISVTGDISNRAQVPVWENMTFGQLIGHLGGRRSGSQGSAIYLIRQGVKKFYRSQADLEYAAEPRAGDIVSLSGDL